MLSAALRRTTSLAHKAHATSHRFSIQRHCRPTCLSLGPWKGLRALSTFQEQCLHDTDLQLGVELTKQHGHPTTWSAKVVREWLPRIGDGEFKTLAGIVVDGSTIPSMEKDVHRMKTLEEIALVRKLLKEFERLCVSVAAVGGDFDSAATTVPVRPFYEPDWFKYVDKTEYLRRVLLDTHPYLILTGPRRFGKSTALDVLNRMMEGSANMFETPGPLDGFWEEWEKYAQGRSVRTIHLDMSNVTDKANLAQYMRDKAAHHGIKLDENADPPKLLRDWVSVINACGYKAALLIDEYDRGAMLALTDETDGPHKGYEKARRWVREVLAPLLAATKPYKDTPLVKVVVCGVATFGIADAGSGANHFVSPFEGQGDLANVLGYTAEEIVTTYPEAATNLVNHHRGLLGEEALSASSELRAVDVRAVLAEEHNGWRLNAHAKQSFSPFVMNRLLVDPGCGSSWLWTGDADIIKYQWDRRGLIGADILQDGLEMDMEPGRRTGMVKYFSASAEATTRMAFDFGYLTCVTRTSADAPASPPTHSRRMVPIGIPNESVRRVLATLWWDHYSAQPDMVKKLGAALTQVPDADDGSICEAIGQFVGFLASRSKEDDTQTLKEEACKFLLFQYLELYTPAVTAVHVERTVAGRGRVDATIHWSEDGKQYVLVVELGMAAGRGNLDTKLRHKVEQMAQKEYLQGIHLLHPDAFIKGLTIVVRSDYQKDEEDLGVNDVRVQRSELSCGATGMKA